MSEVSDDTEIVLASSSPRRLELLSQLGVAVSISPADVDESVRNGESPTDYVHRLARDKSLKVAAMHESALVVGADTTIADGEQIVGKPENRAHAIDMLSSLAGRLHLVHTGVAVALKNQIESCVVTTQVEFESLSLEDIERYVDTGEAFGKAGAYAIQGVGAIMIKRIEGSYSNVVGLPLAETAALLKRFEYCVLSQFSASSPGT